MIMEINEVDVPREELEVVPDVITDDWHPEDYATPSYDDPGNFDGHEVENG